MKRTVLIVEDEPILARNLSRALERVGLQIREASSYTQAMQCFDRRGAQPPDLVCADIRLGDGSGLELARYLKAQHPLLPVIIMTGQDSVAHRACAEGLNAVAFLAKPFSLSYFREVVMSLVPGSVEEHDASQSTLPSPRVMMYSHDTIGLGHMRRNAAIASELLQQVPNISILMLVGCPGGALLDLPAGIDMVKLPSLAKVGRDRWRPGSLRISSEHLFNLRSGLIQRAFEDFDPNVLLIDHEPAGVWGELRPLLAQSRVNGPAVVLGLRDILDQPDVVLKRWRDTGVDQLISNAYDRVLIYGSESVYPSATAYGITNMPDVRAHYCGYVATKPDAAPTTLRPDSGRMPRVAVCGGGGRDAFALHNAALLALADLPRRSRPIVTLVAGPLMDAELSAQLKTRAQDQGVRFMARCDNVPALMGSVDLVVTMGGYNSMVEAVASGVATLVVPRIGPSAEQRIRAELFSRLGLINTASLENDLIGELKLCFRELKIATVTAPGPQSAIRFDGARNAAMSIRALLTKANAGETHSVNEVQRV